MHNFTAIEAISWHMSDARFPPRCARELLIWRGKHTSQAPTVISRSCMTFSFSTSIPTVAHNERA